MALRWKSAGASDLFLDHLASQSQSHTTVDKLTSFILYLVQGWCFNRPPSKKPHPRVTYRSPTLDLLFSTVRPLNTKAIHPSMISGCNTYQYALTQYTVILFHRFEILSFARKIQWDTYKRKLPGGEGRASPYQKNVQKHIRRIELKPQGFCRKSIGQSWLKSAGNSQTECGNLWPADRSGCLQNYRGGTWMPVMYI